MTLDDVAWYPPDAEPVVETPRKHRHVWVGVLIADLETPAGRYGWSCSRCGAVRDETRARRGKTARNRGNRYELEVAEKLGGRRVGMYGDQVDVEVPGWLRVQCKNGGAYPALLDRWLRAIPVQADLLRAVVVGDAPGPGHQRRSLIVLDLEEFASWYAKGGL